MIAPGSRWRSTVSTASSATSSTWPLCYNTAKGKFVGFTDDVTVERTQAGGGWFITRNLEMKAEYVKQIYKDFPVTDIRSGGKFEGMMVEGVVAF